MSFSHAYLLTYVKLAFKLSLKIVKINKRASSCDNNEEFKYDDKLELLETR